MADFQQALRWLEEGKKVRRKKWKHLTFIFLDYDTIRHEDLEVYCPSYNSLKDDEWQLVDDSKTCHRVVHDGKYCAPCSENAIIPSLPKCDKFRT